MCDFESSDFCDLNVYGSDKFNFSIKTGEEFGSGEEGPQTDDENNAQGHFAFIKSGNPGTEEGSSSVITTHMFDAQNHLIECFEFKVAMKREGGVRSITIIQEDQEQEDKPGEMDILWHYTSEQVKNDAWFTGRMEVRAHKVDEIPQNYSVSTSSLCSKSFKNCLR